MGGKLTAKNSFRVERFALIELIIDEIALVMLSTKRFGLAVFMLDCNFAS